MNIAEFRPCWIPRHVQHLPYRSQARAVVATSIGKAGTSNYSLMGAYLPALLF